MFLKNSPPEQTTVTTENFSIDYVTQRQVVEDLGEEFGHFQIVFALDLSFKAVHFVHRIAAINRF